MQNSYSLGCMAGVRLGHTVSFAAIAVFVAVEGADKQHSGTLITFIIKTIRPADGSGSYTQLGASKHTHNLQLLHTLSILIHVVYPNF